MREREQPEPQGAARVTVTLVCAGLGERVKGAGASGEETDVGALRGLKWATKVVSCVTTKEWGLSLRLSFQCEKLLSAPRY